MDTESHWNDRIKPTLILALVLAGSYTAFRASPGAPQVCDSAYSLLVTRNLVEHGEVRLDPFVPADPAERAKMPGYVPELGLPYHFMPLRELDGRVLYDPPENATEAAAPTHYYYTYALGSSLLSTPIVALDMNLGSRSIYAWEERVQLRAAALVSAFTVCLFVLIARAYLNRGWSIATALLFAFASPVWSTMSRGLWSHTWAVCLLAAALLALTRLDRRRGRDWLNGALIGLLAFGVWFVRPQAALGIGSLAIVLLVSHRRALLAAAVATAACAAVYVIWSWTAFSHWSPPCAYFLVGNLLTLDGALDRLPGVLFSPSRGLLIFFPLAAVAAYLACAYRRHVPSLGLLHASLLAMVGQIALLACFPHWWGGASFGPRYFTDVMPWFFLLTVLAVRAFGAAIPAPEAWLAIFRRRAETALLAVCCAWCLFVHARGAIATDTWRWNAYAGRHRELIHDWRYPQFLAGLTYRVQPDGTPLPEVQTEIAER